MRRQGWERLLSEYLEHNAPFVWGERDCALWSAIWAGTATSTDYVSDWLGNYSTQEEAQSFMESKGFTCPADIADHHLDEIPIKATQRGDLVLHPAGMLGICNGLYSHFITQDGQLKLKTLLCERAWKVD